jgi:hypothetical protein
MALFSLYDAMRCDGEGSARILSARCGEAIPHRHEYRKHLFLLTFNLPLG